MDSQTGFVLAPVFQAVQDVMEENRLAYNQADPYNGNHGDHMVAVFAVAVQAAVEKQEEGLAEAMDYAGQLLQGLEGNASAQVYAHGLAQFAIQFRKFGLTFEDLVLYLRKALKEDQDQGANEPARSKDVLKALVAALAGWQGAESGAEKNTSFFDLGYMFDLGVAYLQAKSRNTSRVEVIADAAASVSPLGKVPYRFESGKRAILTLLLALSSS
jgi:hypothetical protein